MAELIFTLLTTVTIGVGYCESPTMRAYTVLPNEVFVCEGKKINATDVFHELSHVWHHRLTDKEKFIIKFLYNYCDKPECFAREYGMTNELENFATVFEIYFYFYLANGGNYSSISNSTLKLKLVYMEYLVNKYE